MKTLIIAAIAACVLPIAAFGENLGKAHLFDCDLSDTRGALGWVQPKVVFSVLENGQVLVSDALILRYKKGPIPTKVTRNDTRILALSWQLSGLVDNSKQRMPAMLYSARLNKKTMKISVHGTPTDSPQKFSGRGTCSIKKP